MHHHSHPSSARYFASSVHCEDDFYSSICEDASTSLPCCSNFDHRGFDHSSFGHSSTGHRDLNQRLNRADGAEVADRDLH